MVVWEISVFRLHASSWGWMCTMGWTAYFPVEWAIYILKPIWLLRDFWAMGTVEIGCILYSSVCQRCLGRTAALVQWNHHPDPTYLRCKNGQHNGQTFVRENSHYKVYLTRWWSTRTILCSFEKSIFWKSDSFTCAGHLGWVWGLLLFAGGSKSCLASYST